MADRATEAWPLTEARLSQRCVAAVAEEACPTMATMGGGAAPRMSRGPKGAARLEELARV